MARNTRQLSDEDWQYLLTHYQLARDAPLDSALTGNHRLLLAALTQLGYPAHSLETAYRLAEKLLWPSY